ncbi:MAG TPA: response regulator, partial [Verrucomicrobiae bacterium]|nr:response regulator [Verrucomicrobiae bacterium]
MKPSSGSSAALIPTDSSITNVAQSQESQAEFTSRVARTRHDLRNCIGQILGFSEMLIEEVQGGGREPLRADLDLIHNRASQMIARIEEGLDRSKIEAGVRDSLALQQTRENAVEVADATKRLLEKARDLRDDVFIDDLSRIGAAADKTLELVSLTYDLLSDAVETIPAAETVLESSAAVIARSWKVPENLQALRQGAILVVDDLAENRELLMRRLSPLGYSITVSENGEQALESVRGCPVDLILLDIFMPGLDGIEVLQRLKANPATQHIPVIMLSSSDKLDNIVHCITLGADDFLPKPFNTTLLMARIESSLSKKRLRDQESAFLARLKAEQEISERLLLNILPRPIAERLKLGEKNIADNFAEATVLFTDFV